MRIDQFYLLEYLTWTWYILEYVQLIVAHTFFTIFLKKSPYVALYKPMDINTQKKITEPIGTKIMLYVTEVDISGSYTRRLM